MVSQFLARGPSFRLISSNMAFNEPALSCTEEVFPVSNKRKRFTTGLRGGNRPCSGCDVPGGGGGVSSGVFSFCSDVFVSEPFNRGVRIVGSGVVILPRGCGFSMGNLRVLHTKIVLNRVIGGEVRPRRDTFATTGGRGYGSTISFSIGDGRVTTCLRNRRVTISRSIGNCATIYMGKVAANFNGTSGSELGGGCPGKLHVLE